ncbi:MAG: hypothetical protein WCO56_12470, partial [Verrucomicrobiota bacterium]
MQHMLETTGMSAGFALALYAHSFLPAIAAEPARLRLLGDWQVEVTATSPGGKPITVTIEVPTPKLVTVTAEKLPSVPLFATNASGWRKGAVLQGVRAQECTSRGLLDPASVQLRAAATPDAMRYDLGSDYLLEPDWGTIGRLPGGRISSNQPVYVTYRHALLRLDSIVMDGTGRIALRPGKPHPAAPLPPVLAEGDRCLANIWLPGRVAKLGPDNLFPILESAYPEPAKPTPTPAEKLL